jgi:hypothetical protein
MAKAPKKSAFNDKGIQTIGHDPSEDKGKASYNASL